MEKEWFAAWFDSPYYHQLYKNHDEDEARQAIDALLDPLGLAPEARVLDLACGKGRHARYLAEKGFDVTGVDISSASIAYARQFEHERLSFFQHDMRVPFRIRYFDAIVNFFTSFGYFENDGDHLRSLRNVAKGLKPGGHFLLDYFNANWVGQHLVRSEVKAIDGLEFHIARWIDNGHVFKSVDFTVEGRPFHFRERVRLFTLADFQGLFGQAGLWLRQIYGGYDLAPFDLHSSKRLILLAENQPPV
jgi:SAM-dependent methyltransferase